MGKGKEAFSFLPVVTRRHDLRRPAATQVQLWKSGTGWSNRIKNQYRSDFGTTWAQITGLRESPCKAVAEGMLHRPRLNSGAGLKHRFGREFHQVEKHISRRIPYSRSRSATNLAFPSQPIADEVKVYRIADDATREAYGMHDCEANADLSAAAASWRACVRFVV